MKFPSAWTKSGTKVIAKPTDTSTPVVARIDMSADVVGKGNCPECRRPMQEVIVNNTKMWACDADRITIPMANANDKNETST